MQMRGTIASRTGYMLHADAWESERFLADVGSFLDLGNEVLSNRFRHWAIHFDELRNESLLEQPRDFLDVAWEIDGDANA